MNKATITARANLALYQIAVVFYKEFETKSLSGQGEEIIFDDGSECVILDDGDILVLDKTVDIYITYNNGRIQS